MDRFTARRKLLKGSLSAPLVLTVTPAAATGSRTTFSACWNRNEYSPPSCVKDSCDQWYRKSVTMYKQQTWDGNRYYIKAHDYGWYKLTSDKEPYTSYTKVWDLPSGCTTHKSVAALCYYDDYGSCRGHSWYTGGGKHVSKSCYASVFGGGTKT